MENMKISFVTTVYNEEETIEVLLNSLFNQSFLPDEVVIVDAGSTDSTIEKINQCLTKINKKIDFKIITKKGNRSVGRNAGIEKAKGDIIVLSDAGCILDKNYIREIVKPFSDTTVDVVAGYYKGKANSVFQKSLIPYALVMPDKVNPEIFLPSTRSMAIRKLVWKEEGGFPEEYEYSEDFSFAKKLERAKRKIFFAISAFVFWIPRRNIIESFLMFYRFALWDIQAGIIRPKVVILFLRYLIGFLMLLYFFFDPSFMVLIILITLFFFYCFWAIMKNYRYVKDWQAIFYLPVIQYTADLAVMLGTIRGFIKRYGI